MSQMNTEDCCPGEPCDHPTRRRFMAVSAGTAGAVLTPAMERAAAALGVSAANVVIIPANKNLSPQWIAALYQRATPTSYTGANLRYIGMPVGGACTGQLYLGGDGRLWCWDIFNLTSAANNDSYVFPNTQNSPFNHGFALRTGTSYRALDSQGFSQITFTGQYPIGRVDYRDSASPVEVTLEAFSPFIPLNADDSTTPATIFVFTLRNTSSQAVDAELLGWLENPVCLQSGGVQDTVLTSKAITAGTARGVQFGARLPRPDLVFEDFERDIYEGWTVTGTAFGAGPVVASAVPSYMNRFGPLNVHGTRFVTSHEFRVAGDPDAHTGKLSRAFTIARRYVNVRVGGGNKPNQACVNIVVDGVVVGTATGKDDERLTVRSFDVARHEGKTATIEIVDNHAGGWGHINCDYIVFSDSPQELRPDILFEDFEKTTYDGWTVEGTAFGPGPVARTEVPSNLTPAANSAQGSRFVTSYNYRSGANDGAVGKLSRTFTVQRRYVNMLVGGGNRNGRTCVNIRVDGAIVASATGANSEQMTMRTLDVGRYHGKTATIEIVDNHSGGWGHINCDHVVFSDTRPARADIVVEDFEKDSYEGWTVEGTAFGSGPVLAASVPSYMMRFGELNVHETRFVTSHQFRVSGDPDAHTGKLTRSFKVQRRYVNVRVGGGNYADKTCVNLIVRGTPFGDIRVASFAGKNSEPLLPYSVDVSGHEGRTATIEIVDTHTGGWGHINCDYIVQSDAAIRQIADLQDGGTIALSALSDAARVRPSIASWGTLVEVFTAGAGQLEADAGRSTLAGAVSVPVTLAAGQSTTLKYVLAWHFPVPDRTTTSAVASGPSLKRHYNTRFATAEAVSGYVASNLARLEGDTRSWTQTWYTDSTLPHWFLERTLATASTLATSTCYRFDNGRFYGWEGVYCCAGTCQHVWNYAEAVARLFPALERDTRERVDLGTGFRPNSGAMLFRGEVFAFSSDDNGWAADGQCGTILRIYREHLTSPPGSDFLARNWPKVKKAVEWVIAKDAGTDGTLEGRQHNTLDADWYGEISWITSMYVAALRAAAAMADERGEGPLAAHWRGYADTGAQFLVTTLWRESLQYFIQRVPASGPGTNAVSHGLGCHIDQMFGQAIAWQLGLSRVMPADKCRTALENLYLYNFAPDPIYYRNHAENPLHHRGREFARAGEHGMVMTTWPIEGVPGDPPGSWQAMYFNEVWTGQEYQLAAHMIAEGLLEKGLTLTRAVHDRYHAGKRNPYNEFECGDHYARAMAGYGVFTAICGFEHHGPRSHIGFAPRMAPENFRAAFTAAEGWGLFRQTRSAGQQTSTVELRFGRLSVRTLAFAVAGTPTSVTVRLNGAVRAATLNGTAGRAEITLGAEAVLTKGNTLEVSIVST